MGPINNIFVLNPNKIFRFGTYHSLTNNLFELEIVI